MGKVKLKRLGGSFSHAYSSTLWKTSQSISYTDQAKQSISIDHFEPATYAWLHESKSIIGHQYELAKKYTAELKNQYQKVFTHDKELIDSDPKFFKFVPACGYWIEDVKIYDKSKLLSFITSNKSMCPGHKFRLEWKNKLEGKCDLYGRGFKEVEKKEEALCDYYFSIAIENGKYDTYFTEKILDCFAVGTVPVYYGTNNIGKYFDMEGIIVLNDSFDPGTLTPELYYSMLPAIKRNYEKVKAYNTVEDWIYQYIV